MTSKSRSVEELLGNNPKSLSPTQPVPPDTSEPDETPGETPKTGVVENFDNTGNGVTDNMPVDWDERAPSGAVVYGSDSSIPSENAVVSTVVSTAVYASENEFDDKGLKDPDVEEPPVEPPVEETESPTK